MKRLIPAFVVGLCVSVSGQDITYTHFVTPDGIGTGSCTVGTPCSLTRAVTANLRAGSIVRIAPGVYSQGPLTFKGNGVRFVGDGEVRIVGTRTKPVAWTLTPGQRYTYEAPFTAYGVSNVAQRPPVPSWRPILVDDRKPPYTVSQGRPFTLDFPIRYTQRASVAQVEAQSCTFWHDAAAGKLYVHMCHDGAPADADKLYAGSYLWGALTFEGDDNTLENVTLEQVASTALKVTTKSDRTTLRNIKALSSQVWLEGTNTLAEDLEVGYIIAQGTIPNTNCYDANPDFGVGECWQGSAKGDALLVGRQGSALNFNQTIRRAFVHRSWNGARVDGPNTLEASKFWGFPNHTLQVSGSGVTLRNNVFLKGQDSLYMEGNAFDNLVVEHNAFVNGVLVWASRDGRPVGVAPTAWTFRYNILAAILMDDRTFPAATLDCNAYIPLANPSHLLKITSTSGGSSITYKTLAQVKASTTLEANSVELPYTWWTKGRIFKNFTGQSSPDFDSGDPLRVCGQRVGPQ